MKIEKEKPICKYCGSDKILVDSYSRWDVETQQWVHDSAYDTVFCNACETEGSYAHWEVVRKP